MSRGKLITLEGIDGSGKTSQLAVVCRWLRQNGIAYLSTCEPGGTPLGKQIRSLLTAKEYLDMDWYAELLLFFADRAQHISRIVRPALDKGWWVVSDRFYDASYAYQGGGRGIPLERIDILVRWVCQGLKPDLSLLLDIDPEIVWQRNSQCQARLFEAGEERDHRFESGQMNQGEREKRRFFAQVRDAYLRQAKREPQRWRTIRAGRQQNVIAAEITSILDDFSGKPKASAKAARGTRAHPRKGSSERPKAPTETAPIPDGLKEKPGA